MRSRDLATLALMALIVPARADLGVLRGTTRQETMPATKSVSAFARTWGLAAEQIAWANGTSPEAKLEKGSKVTLPARILPANPPTDGAVVNLAERGAYLFKGGEYKGFFPVAIGRGDKVAFRTPLGSYKIDSRMKNPPWVAPNSPWAKAMKKEKIAANSSKNPLGEYWFGISHPKGGYGFHENVDPNTTGSNASHGCMRLYPEQANRIFAEELLLSGYTVRIENRPVVMGQDKNGELYVSLFPSAYGKSDAQAALSKEFEKQGLLGVVPADRLETLASNKSGVPQSVLGKPVALMVDGKKATTTTPGLKRAGSLIVPVSLAKELGCQVAYDAKTGAIAISKNGKSKAFTLNPKSDGNKAYRWKDQTMVSARSLLVGLDIPYAWNGKTRQLEIQG